MPRRTPGVQPTHAGVPRSSRAAGTSRTISGLVGAAQHDAELARMWHERVYLPTRTVTVERIRRAQAGGRLPDIDPQILADLLAAPIWFRFLLAGGDPSPEHADAVFQAVLR
ncbi:TetR/AcrR family transcriptional regulator C-terminal ligand-binding domain-containing protein [Nonomuraea sp. NBC_01738]|uniref:TetR-like C-terminal domain-containing protein n=1 Tax=Nonomuraea sp. NBC_01738 TaxID=2976003 RepID=UPI002E10D682|nr:TetR/AcrR family transcriptional regulator C-terminal ligand-binding domain-containing protein [Nonomuraea sp. NBC_01738]